MTPAYEQSDALHGRVQRFIEAATARPAEERKTREPFDELAVAICRHQAARVPAVGRLMAARGISAARLERADQIPAVPCEAFKLGRIAAHRPELDQRCFRTSGTTAGAEARGEHPMRTTATYSCAALGWAKRMLWPDCEALRLVALVPSETSAPDSSLSFMLARFAERLGLAASWHVQGQQLDVDGVLGACARARTSGEPVLVAGTAFAFAHLCDALGAACLELPAASRAMPTGGFKGRSRELEPAELGRRIAALLGIPDSHVVGEYGMTELSSQLYQGSLAEAVGADLGLARPDRYLAPPWTRVTAVDTAELSPLSPGEPGLGRVVDLANVDSAVAVQTADLVRCWDDGTVELLGRAPGASARGCSLDAEQLRLDSDR